MSGPRRRSYAPAKREQFTIVWQGVYVRGRDQTTPGRFRSKRSSAIRKAKRVASRLGIDLSLQMIGEEIIDTVPCVGQDMRACEVMEFAGIHHERKQRASPLLKPFVDEPDGFEIRNIDVGGTVQNEQRTSEAIDM